MPAAMAAFGGYRASESKDNITDQKQDDSNKNWFGEIVANQLKATVNGEVR